VQYLCVYGRRPFSQLAAGGREPRVTVSVPRYAAFHALVDDLCTLGGSGCVAAVLEKAELVSGS